jgi:predicted TIM-barrel fold metal-dependent hydrolase
MRCSVMTAFVLLVVAHVSAQDGAPRPLIIDMHLHAHTLSMYGTPPPSICANNQEILFPAWDPHEPLTYADAKSCPARLKAPETDEELLQETLSLLKHHNIRAVTTGSLDQVTKWYAGAPDRIIRAIPFAEPKYETRDPAAFRRLFAEGKFAVFAEVSPQYDGVSIADPSLEPYFALAEEMDIPVGIHMGEGPPGAAYLFSPKYRARLTSPFLLEEVLVRHPRLRVYVMHYGSPLVDEMLSMLYSHPQLYVDVAGNDWSLPRKEFHSHLRRLVEAGFEKRIMFGSDEMVWPGTIKVAIESIESADFLDEEQKRDIFCRNAARFLRMDVKSCGE